MINQDITKFEFLLTLEKNIVIQRYFNVIGYNPEARTALDLHECVTRICKDITNDLKDKTLALLNEENLSVVPAEVRAEEIKNLKEEYFLLRIKLGEEVFISRIFPAHIYHPKARYAVDIRPKVRKILGDLTEVLSSKRLTKTYLQYELK